MAMMMSSEPIVPVSCQEPTSMLAPRRLTVMVSLDVAGFTRLVQEDERATLVAVTAIRQDLIDATLPDRNGHIFKTMGDGVLIEFPNVEDAVSWTVEFQEAMAVRNQSQPDKLIVLRAGIALADVYIAGEDRAGAAIAAVVRLQEAAPAGGIAMTHSVRWQLGKALVARFARVTKTLKGKDEPGEVWVWTTSGVADGDVTAAGPPRRPNGDGDQPSVVLDKPSLAVLPFQNMSGDPEQEYFADGIVEEIITALSRMSWLFVIARHSSFTYRGRAVDVQKVARELGVRYILEGSVRKAGTRLRIAGRLVDASTGAHLWADRYDGGLGDIFDLQDKVTASVVGAIGPKLERAEIERSRRKPTESLVAYDYYLRGIADLRPATREGSDVALRLLYRAIELDPHFATAYGVASWIYSWRRANTWVDDAAHERAETARLARRAVELGQDDALALAWGGYSLWQLRELDDAVAFIDRALELNPNLAVAWRASGWARISLGEPDLAIEHLARAMRLSPFDPMMPGVQLATAYAHFFAGRYDEASHWAIKAQRADTHLPAPRSVLAASSAMAGRLDEARMAMAALCQRFPTRRISNIHERLFVLRRSGDLARYVEGLRTAGMPE